MEGPDFRHSVNENEMASRLLSQQRATVAWLTLSALWKPVRLKSAIV
jgi:hypothetical protein